MIFSSASLCYKERQRDTRTELTSAGEETEALHCLEGKKPLLSTCLWLKQVHCDGSQTLCTKEITQQSAEMT